MISPALTGVFANAALAQKIVLIVLVAAIPLTLISMLVAMRGGAAATIARRVVSDMRVAAPTLGLLTAGLNSFHMAEGIVNLPFDLTLKQVAPGIFEVSALVSLGALAGIVAVAAHAAISLMASRQRTY